MFEAVIIEAGAFDPRSKYSTRTNATPSNFISLVSDASMFAKTGGITELIESRKSKLFVMYVAIPVAIAAIGMIDIRK